MMWSLSILFCMTLLLICCSLIGCCVAELLPFRLRPHAKYYFAPILGTGIFIPIISLYGWFFPFNSVFSRLLFLGIVITCLVNLYNKKHVVHISYVLILLTFGLFISSLELTFLLRFDYYPTYDDTYTYLIHSHWLQHHPFSYKLHSSFLSPDLSNILIYQTTMMRMGGSYFLVWLQTLFGFEWSYDTYPLVIIFILTIGSLAVAGATALICRGGRFFPLMIGGLAGLGLNGFVFGAYFGFLPQTFGLAFSIAEIALFGALLLYLYKAPNIQFMKLFIYSLPVTLLFSDVIYTYHEICPVLLSSHVLCLIWSKIANTLKWRQIISLSLIFIIQIVFFTNIELHHLYDNIMALIIGGRLQEGFGWSIPWAPWEFLGLAVSMKSAHMDAWLFSSSLLNFIFILVAVALITYMLAIFYKNKRRMIVVLPHVYMLIMLLLIFIKLRYFSAGNTSFIQFKTAKWASLSATTLFGAAIVLIYLKKLTIFTMYYRKITLFFFMCGLIFNCAYINYMSLSKLPNRPNPVLGDYKYPLHKLLCLRKKLESTPKNQYIYLKLNNGFNSLSWIVSYLLYDRPIIVLTNEDANAFKQESSKPDTNVIVLGESIPINGALSQKGHQLTWFTSKDPIAILHFQDEGYLVDLHKKHHWKWSFKSSNFSQRTVYRIVGNANAVQFHFNYIADQNSSLNLILRSKHEIIKKILVPIYKGKHSYSSQIIPLFGNVDVIFDLLLNKDNFGNLTTLKMQKWKVNALLNEKSIAQKSMLSKKDSLYLVSVEGLSSSEPWGTWSKEEQVVFDFNKNLPKKFKLIITSSTVDYNEGMPVKIKVGDDQKKYYLSTDLRSQSLNFSTNMNTNKIVFTFPSLKSPKKHGKNADPRKLGIGFHSLEIVTESNSPE